MKKARSIGGDSPQHAHSVSRLLDSDAGFPGDADDWPNAYPECESCHWTIVETRPFKGRELCLSCIAEYFAGDSEDE
jgi:hypothetical protein